MIVALSQILIYLVYLLPVRKTATLELEGNLWILFVIDTVLIAAAGYVINDIFDQGADKLNKPGKQYIGEGRLSAFRAWVYYIGLVFLGFAIAFYIAYQIDKMMLLRMK